ncbi:MAG: Endoribonuclease MazF6 [Acidobacteria bacterium]|nr:Endoribonuclease MazF6 [Acidobacteriota bacterium]
MRRGDIWWATLPPPVGSGPGGRRPVIIAQADHVTKSHIRTVVIVTVTSNLKLARYTGNVLLPSHLSGLERDSVANVSQIFSIDRTLLTEYVATLPNSLMDEVDEGLRLILDLF